MRRQEGREFASILGEYEKYEHRLRGAGDSLAFRGWRPRGAAGARLRAPATDDQPFGLGEGKEERGRGVNLGCRMFVRFLCPSGAGRGKGKGGDDLA